ncbi:MAG: helix-turn-helix domain-containing protein [Parafannyhessea sp.]|uniref:helix-turn-helix domain-containing protein n=1 Tax=Parafannyhessea sp. TaxID=2847324 RepID=UPI003F051F91
MIDARGLTDAQVYNRANLTRQYFSKLRSGKIHPSKRVVLALAVALGLDLGQTRLLLGRAGYSLAHNSKFDVIVEFYIGRGVHDVDAINRALFRHDQQLLGVS